MSKILVTGGSGFIGSNLVEYFVDKGHEVVNIDIAAPRNKKYANLWNKVDILDKKALQAVVASFAPDYVVHLAARTDLAESKSLAGYAANVEGTQNIVEIINAVPEVKRTIYASSRMVCRIDYIPKSFTDYCPPNLYGESKMEGEKIVRQHAAHDFVIVRPTSIWGPYFEIPYRTFFDTVKKGLFFLPKGENPKKSFGFVGNTVFQIDKILFSDKNVLEQNYYLTDYPPLELKNWSTLVRAEFEDKPILEIPMFPLKLAAKAGDILQKAGWKNPPLTSFRLNNLLTDMVYDTTNLEKLCGKLPFSLKEGVKITADWMKKQ